MRRLTAITLLTLSLLSGQGFAATASLDETVADLSHRWAKASYQTGAAAQKDAFAGLVLAAQSAVQAYPDRAEPLIWQSIALASSAGAEGGLGALSKVKAARELLLQAEKLNPAALDGSIYCTLGSLYAKVPGWPIGYGDKAKARAYLGKALAINPEGIDAHYFLGELLAGEGAYAKAAEHLERALRAGPRAGREDSDAGRRQEARLLLDDLRKNHGVQTVGVASATVAAP